MLVHVFDEEIGIEEQEEKNIVIDFELNVLDNV